MLLRDRVLSRSPNCIYCGGVTPATTVDHVPPISIFDNRDRPSGLEFAACLPCNNGAGRDELVAAWISRAFPDPETPKGEQEIEDILRGVSNNWPGLLEELQPAFWQDKAARRSGGAGALNCRGPILNNVMKRFAAKIGFALHFQQTGRPVPIGGGAGVWWMTNVQQLEGKMPTDLLALMSGPRTLRQGKKDVGAQFGYDSVSTETGSITAHFATFRFSFAVGAFVGDKEEDITPRPKADHVSVYKPGWLQNP